MLGRHEEPGQGEGGGGARYSRCQIGSQIKSLSILSGVKLSRHIAALATKDFNDYTENSLETEARAVRGRYSRAVRRRYWPAEELQLHSKVMQTKLSVGSDEGSNTQVKRFRPCSSPNPYRNPSPFWISNCFYFSVVVASFSRPIVGVSFSWEKASKKRSSKWINNTRRKGACHSRVQSLSKALSLSFPQSVSQSVHQSWSCSANR